MCKKRGICCNDRRSLQHSSEFSSAHVDSSSCRVRTPWCTALQGTAMPHVGSSLPSGGSTTLSRYFSANCHVRCFSTTSMQHHTNLSHRQAAVVHCRCSQSKADLVLGLNKTHPKDRVTTAPCGRSDVLHVPSPLWPTTANIILTRTSTLMWLSKQAVQEALTSCCHKTTSACTVAATYCSYSPPGTTAGNLCWCSRLMLFHFLVHFACSWWWLRKPCVRRER